MGYPSASSSSSSPSSSSSSPTPPLPPVIFYYNIIFSVGVLASLLSSIIVGRRSWASYRRHRARLRMQNVVWSMRAPDSCQVLNNRLLISLCGIHVISYLIFALCLPLLWRHPNEVLFALHSSPGYDHPVTKPAKALNALLLLPALVAQYLWHTIITLMLFCLIVRKEPADLVTTRLTTLTRLGGGVVIMTLMANIASIFNAMAEMGRLYVSSISLAGLSFLVFITYAVTIAYLLLYGNSGGTSSTRSTRNVRLLTNRMSILCAFLMLRISACFSWYCTQLTGQKYVSIDIMAGTTVAYEGLVDSLVMGNLCRVDVYRHRLPMAWLRWLGAKSNAHGINTARLRQVMDSRIRLGQSVLAISDVAITDDSPLETKSSQISSSHHVELDMHIQQRQEEEEGETKWMSPVEESPASSSPLSQATPLPPRPSTYAACTMSHPHRASSVSTITEAPPPPLTTATTTTTTAAVADAGATSSAISIEPENYHWMAEGDDDDDGS